MEQILILKNISSTYKINAFSTFTYFCFSEAINNIDDLFKYLEFSTVEPMWLLKLALHTQEFLAVQLFLFMYENLYSIY